MADKLKQLLENLPMELYDEILDLTFTPFKAGHNVRITQKHRFPKLLRVSSFTRELFARRRFSYTVFTSFGYPFVAWWLCTLQKEHLDYLTSVRIFVDVAEQPITDVVPAKRACSNALAYMEHCRFKGYVHDSSWVDKVSVETQRFGKRTFASYAKNEWA